MTQLYAHRVDVTDPSRTVVDLLANPSCGGGIRHVADVLEDYFSSEHRNDQLLISYGDRFGAGSIFKRLGFLIELLSIDGRTWWMSVWRGELPASTNRSVG